MDIISVNAERHLINLAASIGRSPQSWRGWHCLQIMLGELDENLQHECMFWARSLIEAYLKAAVGRVYFCENSSIHILCKNVPLDILYQAGQEISDLAYSESSVYVDYVLHSFPDDGEYYVHDVLRQSDDLFSLSADQQNILNKRDDKMPLYAEQSFKADGQIVNNHAKVMLVEDDPVTRWMVRNTLKDACDFVTAQTANKAFSMYTSYQPDIVFLDINLPDKSGYDVLEWIMRNDPGAVVVMFSSNDHMDNIMSALERGASGFIGKPFIKQQLLDYIQGHA